MVMRFLIIIFEHTVIICFGNNWVALKRADSSKSFTGFRFNLYYAVTAQPFVVKVLCQHRPLVFGFSGRVNPSH